MVFPLQTLFSSWSYLSRLLATGSSLRFRPQPATRIIRATQPSSPESQAGRKALPLDTVTARTPLRINSGGNLVLVGLSESKAHAWILIAKPVILSPPCMVRRFVSQAALSSFLTSLYPRSFIPVFNSPAAASPHSKLGLPQMGPPKGNPVLKGSRSTVLDKNQPHCLIFRLIHVAVLGAWELSQQSLRRALLCAGAPVVSIKLGSQQRPCNVC